MQLPILGATQKTLPINPLTKPQPQSEEAAQTAHERDAKAPSPSKTTHNAYPSPPVTAETKASLLALQEDASPNTPGSTPPPSPAPTPAETPVQSVKINGLSIIISGHSVDARDGVSLLRTLSVSESRSMMADIASMEDSAGNEGVANSKSGSNIIRLDKQGYVMDVEAEALGPLPDGATSAYMNEDFLHSRGRWTNGHPFEMGNSEQAIQDQRRTRLETLMNTVDAERQLRAQYGQDVKLVYSHVDDSYIMLTPDDAKYDTMNSAESGIQGVIDEMNRGFMDKETVVNTLQRYGYHI